MKQVDASRTRGKPVQDIHPVARNIKDWEHWLTQRGERGFRAQQIFQWIHSRAVFDPQQMTNLSKPLRGLLEQEGVTAPASIESVARSSDGTRKLLVRLSDGRAVECVLIPMSNQVDADVAATTDDDEADGDEVPASGPSTDVASKPAAPSWTQDEPRRRITLCVSTQVGCAMACRFCASGQAGLSRGLGAAEIIAQVLLAKAYLDEGEQLRNLVFMGMGEPLHHYDETVRALHLITNSQGIGISPRKITVSTVGLVPNIRRLGEEFSGKIGLAVSLHAPDDETRDQIMPVNQRYPVAELLESLRQYPLPKRRRITIEYTLIAGINDSDSHARRLAKLLRGLPSKVNLIPMNPIDQAPFGAPTEARVDAFRAILGELRVSCSVRRRRGDDVDAACGQLALRAGVKSAETIQLGRKRGAPSDEPSE